MSDTFKLILFVFFALVFTACTKETAQNSPEKEANSEINHGTNYETISKPACALSEEMKQMFLIYGQDKPYFIFRLDTTNGESFVTCTLNSENKWDTQKAPWSDFITKHNKDGLYKIACDSQGGLYIFCSNSEYTDYSLYFVGEGLHPQELNIKDIFGIIKEQKVVSFNLIKDDKLVFFFSEDETDLQGNAVEYDVAREKFTEESGCVDDFSASFDEEGYYYTVSPRQKVITKKTIYEELPKQLIKCEAITEECTNNLLVIRDECGYLMTAEGIYGGKLEDEQWKNILPIGSMKYPKDFPSPVMGTANIEKVSGDDEEFYVMTWRNMEFTDFEWVHYIV